MDRILWTSILGASLGITSVVIIAVNTGYKENHEKFKKFFKNSFMLFWGNSRAGSETDNCENCVQNE